MVNKEKVCISKRSRMSLSMLWLLMFLVIAAGCSSGSGSNELDSKSSSLADSPASSNQAAGDVAAKTEQSSTEGSEEHLTADNNTGGGAAAEANAAVKDRKLIYSANLVMEVKDYEAAKQRIQDMIHLSGGYILEFNDQYSEYERAGIFKIKVPAQGFQSMLEQLNKLEHLRYERNYSATDVTEEYVDLAARLKVAKVEEARLLSFMEQAKNTSDLLKFSQDLAASQEKIERIQGRMNYLDQNVAMSTIELRLYETLKQGNEPSALEKTFGERLGGTLQASVESLINLLQGLVLLLAAMLPYLIVLLIIGLPVLWIVKRSQQHRNERYKERQKEMMELNQKMLAQHHVGEAEDDQSSKPDENETDSEK
ncbi:DUF4349 domain-containing protein [Paenibacillus sp. 1001270B_150601_E10]|uniref:DUF4349 domain-containing protein n=1 Tax=Paenibacillus sp. 1001270B_150601_E10 TaxID=2787079 RepID=UPI0018A03092|nr:DUF4349 domain-containing protein [Paenibacillus sp. 1001270B_150601_E10]